MKIFTLLIIWMMLTPTTLIFNFNSEKSISAWQIVNDGVMGGLSSSNLSISDEGNGVFSGHVSLANNGGFASVRHNKTYQKIDEYDYVVLRIKGDGKKYQFRLKGDNNQRQSYVQEFKTTDEWQQVRLKISDFYPQFRGQKLNMPNFNFDTITEIAFLIGNKREEDFRLVIDQIALQ